MKEFSESPLWRNGLCLTILMCSLIFTPVASLALQNTKLSNVLDVLLISSDAFRLLEWWLCWYVGAPVGVSATLSVLALFPMYSIPVGSAIGFSPSVLAYFHLPRLILIFQVKSSVRRVFQDLASRNISVDETSRRIADTMILGLLYAFITASIWKWLGSGSGWLDVFADKETLTPFSSLVLSLHFIIQTSFTIGYGDIYPTTNLEIVFSLLLIFNALLFFAFIIAILTSMFSNFNVCKKRFRADMELLKRYFNNLHLSDNLTTPIFQYFEFLFDRQFGMMEKDMFRMLPTGLVKEIMSSYYDQLKSIPFFNHQSDDFIRGCLQRMRFRTFAPGTVIVSQDEKRRELFLIRTGRIDVFNEDIKGALTTLVPGDCLGEFQLIFGTAFELGARSVVFTEVMVLTYEDFSKAVEDATATAEELHGTTILASKWLESQPKALTATVEAHKKFLNRFVTVQETVERTVNNKRMAAMMRQMSRRITVNWAIMPENRFRIIWDIIIGICSMYYVVGTPMRVMIWYSTQSSLRRSWHDSYGFDYLCDALFFVDFILRGFFYAYSKFESDLLLTITSPGEIWQKFSKSRRARLQAVILIPVELFSLWTGGGIPLYRLTKLLSCLLLQETIATIVQFLDQQCHVVVSSEAVNFFQLALVTTTTIVWTSTLWSIANFPNGAAAVVASFYWCLTTMTTVGFGDITPQDDKQTLIVIAFAIVGPLLCATIIATFASYVHSVDVSPTNLDHRKAVSQHFLDFCSKLNKCGLNQSKAGAGGPRSDLYLTRSRTLRLKIKPISSSKTTRFAQFSKRIAKIACLEEMEDDASCPMDSSTPPCADPTVSIHEEVNCYFAFIHQERSGIEERTAISRLLPEHIRQDLKIQRYFELFKRDPVFSSCNDSFLRELCLSLKSEFVAKGSVIMSNIIRSPGSSSISLSSADLRQSDNRLEMFFIFSGSVVVSDHFGRKTTQKVAGESFGTLSLFSETTNRRIQVKAASNCELLSLRRSDFDETLRKYPSEHNQLPTMRSLAVRASQMLLDRSQSFYSLQQIKIFRDHQAYFISPNGAFHQAWTAILILFLLYNLLVIPLRIAFFQSSQEIFASIDWSCDAYLVMDIIFRVQFLAFFDHEDLIAEKAKIWRRYASSRQVWWHVAASIPLDKFALLGPWGILSSAQTVAVLRLNKLLRVCDFDDSIATLTSLILKSAYLSRFVSKNVIQIVKLISTVCLTAHVFGCAFFSIASLNSLRGLPNWAEEAGLLNSDTSLIFSRNSTIGLMQGNSSIVASSFHHSEQIMFSQYIHSVYWAVQLLTTVGYGDICPVGMSEQLFTMLCFVIGTAVFALVIVNLQDIVAQLDVTADIFKARQSLLKKFLLREKLSSEFIERADSYMNKLWTVQRGASGQEISEFLPKTLYSEAVGDILLSQMQQCFFFSSSCSQEFLKTALENVVMQTYLQGDYLFHGGETCNTLFFMVSGEIGLNSERPIVANNTAKDDRWLHKEGTLGASYFRSFIGNKFQRKHASRNGQSSFVQRSYANIIDGCIGEYEFFTRGCFACAGKATTDVVVFELSFSSFWSLVTEYQMEKTFAKMLDEHIQELLARSTTAAVKRVNGNLLSGSKVMKMLTTQLPTSSLSWVIMPDSMFQLVWTSLNLVFLMYFALSIPYFIGFSSDATVAHAAVDALWSIFVWLDIYLNLKYFAVVEDGCLITERSIFSKLYRKRHFVADTVASLPLALVVVLIEKRFSIIFACCRCVSLFHFCRARHFTTEQLRLLEVHANIHFSKEWGRIAAAVAIVWYFGHWTACFFCLLGQWEYSHGNQSWIEANDLLHNTSAEVFLRAYLWSMYTIVTVGYGSISLVSDGERVFSLLVMITGAVLCNAGVSAVLSSIIGSADSLRGTSRRALESSVRFCSCNCSDPQVRSRIAGYTEYQGVELESSCEIDDFDLLPPSLRQDFVTAGTATALHELLPLYLEPHCNWLCRQGFIYSVCRAMELYIAIPGEILVKGDSDLLSRNLFILRRGKIKAQERNLTKEGRYFQPGQAILPELLFVNEGETASHCAGIENSCDNHEDSLPRVTANNIDHSIDGCLYVDVGRASCDCDNDQSDVEQVNCDESVLTDQKLFEARNTEVRVDEFWKPSAPCFYSLRIQLGDSIAMTTAEESDFSLTDNRKHVPWRCTWNELLCVDVTENALRSQMIVELLEAESLMSEGMVIGRGIVDLGKVTLSDVGCSDGFSPSSLVVPLSIASSTCGKTPSSSIDVSIAVSFWKPNSTRKQVTTTACDSEFPPNGSNADLKQFAKQLETALRSELSDSESTVSSDSDSNERSSSTWDAIADSYCHLFYIPASKLREIRQYYRLAREPVITRLTKLPNRIRRKVSVSSILDINKSTGAIVDAANRADVDVHSIWGISRNTSAARRVAEGLSSAPALNLRDRMKRYSNLPNVDALGTVFERVESEQDSSTSSDDAMSSSLPGGVREITDEGKESAPDADALSTPEALLGPSVEMLPRLTQLAYSTDFTTFSGTDPNNGLVGGSFNLSKSSNSSIMSSLSRESSRRRSSIRPEDAAYFLAAAAAATTLSCDRRLSFAVVDDVDAGDRIGELDCQIHEALGLTTLVKNIRDRRRSLTLAPNHNPSD